MLLDCRKVSAYYEEQKVEGNEHKANKKNKN